uniref:Uncharacterized protein n=1 Tax=Oryza glumipatula TaxID=40148 RepID=A0A0E0B710_9ORYZ
MAATTGYCRSPSPEHCRPNPRATGLALMSRPISHYSHFFYRPEQAFAAAVPASSLTSTADLCRPRMRVDGEHVMLPTSPRFGHRRAGAPLSLFYFGWQPVVFRGSDNQVAYLGFICVGARQVIIPLL